MYLVKPESSISYILFPSWFSASVKDTIYLLSRRRNLARKVRYVFFITNCRIFDLLVCGRRGIGSQRWLWGFSLPFTLLAVSEHSVPADQGACKDSPISASPLTAGKTASQMHVSTASFAGVLGFWTHVLSLSWQTQTRHHWASLMPPKSSLNQN